MERLVLGLHQANVDALANPGAGKKRAGRVAVGRRGCGHLSAILPLLIRPLAMLFGRGLIIVVIAGRQRLG